MITDFVFRAIVELGLFTFILVCESLVKHIYKHLPFTGNLYVVSN